MTEKRFYKSAAYLRLFLPLMVFLAFIALPVCAFAERSMRIAVVVNEDAITEADVEDRMILIMASAGLPNSKEVRDNVRPQVLNSLIEERLMLQEAARNNIQVTDEELQTGFAEIAKQNNFEPAQFQEIMQRGGIPIQTLFDQIESQISWTRFIQEVLRQRVDVKDSDVDVRLDRLRSNIGQTEYLVSEIFLPVDKTEDEAEVTKLAKQLVKEMRAGQAPFQGVARQFSKAAGAEQGGNLGWVQKGQLIEELDEKLTTMEKGNISDPVQTSSGIHILNLREQRVIEERIIPGRSALINQIGMERLDRLQRKTLQNLKADAFIDRRV